MGIFNKKCKIEDVDLKKVIHKKNFRLQNGGFQIRDKSNPRGVGDFLRVHAKAMNIYESFQVVTLQWFMPNL